MKMNSGKVRAYLQLDDIQNGWGSTTYYLQYDLRKNVLHN